METWLPVPGYESLYEASSSGYVRSIGIRCGTKVGRIMSFGYDKDGYRRVEVRGIDGKRHAIRVHRIVASLFIGPCPNGKEVNHKDGVKTNNDYVNLEYVTPEENQRHAMLNNLKAVGERNGYARLASEDIRYIRLLDNDGLQGNDIAELTGVSTSHVNSIIHRKVWKHLE